MQRSQRRLRFADPLSDLRRAGALGALRCPAVVSGPFTRPSGVTTRGRRQSLEGEKQHGMCLSFARDKPRMKKGLASACCGSIAQKSNAASTWTTLQGVGLLR